ncbi:hypothetical protein IW261DRAFT_1610322 [Armillaria novae-zelandiae]|uniref:Uncharacterized protein n=1 Tax=Armillaria novae-zelandiae TaxID=153914 RepID=A0AA39U6E8_9AGAR|nr:hypothetical protein IW261DRAFT_1610322 [Armillaria novae-zelandiae]
MRLARVVSFSEGVCLAVPVRLQDCAIDVRVDFGAVGHYVLTSGYPGICYGTRRLSLKPELPSVPNRIQHDCCDTHPTSQLTPISSCPASRTLAAVSNAAVLQGDMARPIVGVPVFVFCSPSPQFLSTYQVTSATTTTDFSSASGTATVAKPVGAFLPAPSLRIPVLLASNCDEDFSSPSSAAGMMSPPQQLYSSVKYIVVFTVVIVVFVPSTTLHEITPSLVSDADYTHFSPLSAAATIEYP